MKNRKNGRKRNTNTNIVQSHIAYDDAFRTMETECDDALLAFINYVYGETYDSTAVIERLRNEHFIIREDGKKEKRVADSHFRIMWNGAEKRYHMECESRGYSKSIMVRMFQYEVQRALTESQVEHDRIKIKIPNSALLVLRNIGAPPETMVFEIETPGGSVSYRVPVICESRFTVEDIFSKELYFLLPFYIFNLERELDVMERSTDDLSRLESILEDILERLRVIPEERLSLRTKGIIVNLTLAVADRLAHGRRKVRKAVEKVMGRGRVIKLDWLERFDAAVAAGTEKGIKQGITQGITRGERRALVRLVCRKLRRGKDPKQIADELDEEEGIVQEICEAAYPFAPTYDVDRVMGEMGF